MNVFGPATQGRRCRLVTGVAGPGPSGTTRTASSAAIRHDSDAAAPVGVQRMQTDTARTAIITVTLISRA